ncbi:MAG TPA: pectinesterase family protein [Polyangiaceae bacterium]|nr:pectinesterase family protein [Polyangiaceae bacterium]
MGPQPEGIGGAESADAGYSEPTPTPSLSEPPAPSVPLPVGLDAMFPLPGATDLCPDPALHLQFPETPTLGSSGKVSIFDADDPSSPVVTIDLSQSVLSDTIGGATFKLSRVAYVDGKEVIFTLPSRGLGYGKTFYVTIAQGVIKQAGGQDFVIDDSDTWRFSTASGAPADTGELRVALDGTGQFCGVQSAIDAAQDDTTISIGAGNYYGIIYFKGKRGLTLSGDDRDTTALKGINNDKLNSGTRARALIGSENVSNLVVENLTIENLTPQDGSQAEALALLSCDQCIVKNSNILSLQDTLLWQGRIYADNCYIAGNVDYIWGTGSVYFNACEIHTLGRKGYNVQARNAAGKHGYVFVDSKLTSDPGITGDILARIDVSQYPASEVAYIDCEIGPHISSAGWVVTGGSAGGSLRFVEYGSHDPSGNAIDTSQRLSGSRQLSSDEADAYRDPAQFFDGWSP